MILSAADDDSDGVLSFAEFAKGVVPVLQERMDSLHANDAGSTTAFAASRCVSYAFRIRHICVFLALLTTPSAATLDPCRSLCRLCRQSSSSRMSVRCISSR